MDRLLLPLFVIDDNLLIVQIIGFYTTEFLENVDIWVSEGGAFRFKGLSLAASAAPQLISDNYEPLAKAGMR